MQPTPDIINASVTIGKVGQDVGNNIAALPPIVIVIIVLIIVVSIVLFKRK